MGFTGGQGSHPRLRILIKKISQTIQNDVTLTDDDDLQFEAKANTNYFIFYTRFASTTANPDFKEAFSAPAGATLNRISTFWHGGGGDVAVDFLSVLVSFGPFTEEMNTSVCLLNMGATAGTVALQWAANGNFAEDTTLNAGSCLIIVEADGN